MVRDDREPGPLLLAERAALGAALIHPQAAATVATRLHPDDLDGRGHPAVLRAIQQLHRDGQPVTPWTVEIALRGHPDRPDDHAYLPGLTGVEVAAPPEHVHLAIQAVIEGSTLRALHRIGRRLTGAHEASDPRALGRVCQEEMTAALDRREPAQTAEEETYVPWPRLDHDDEDADTFWVAPPLLGRARSTLLYGDAKSGKSLLALDLALAVALGRPWLGGRTAVQPGHVVYLDYEMTMADLRDRMQAMDVDHLTSGIDRLHYALATTWAPLDTVEGGTQLLAEAARLQAVAVVIDTHARCVQGEENSADTVNLLHRHTLRPLTRAGVAVLRLDHAGKDRSKGARGSSAKTGDVDDVWRLDDTGGGTLQITRERSRHGRGPGVLGLIRDEWPVRHRTVRFDHITDAKVRTVVDALQRLDAPKDTPHRVLKAMLRDAGAKGRDTVIRDAIEAWRGGRTGSGKESDV